MRLNRKGITLVELIISIALLGIIAVGVIPGFTSQLKIMQHGNGITEGAFDAQAVVESAVYEIRGKIQKNLEADLIGNPQLTQPTRSVFGVPVTMYRLTMPFPANAGKTITVYMSSKMAKKEKQTSLVANPVRIAVDTDPVNNRVASRTSKLTGQCTLLTDPSFYAYINRWYVSRVGVANPEFPNDYTLIELPGIDPPTLDNLLSHAGVNRYVTYTVTPVDSLGLRGAERESINKVFIMGEEWRSGIQSWVDKNDTGEYEFTDTLVPNEQLKTQLGFDSQVAFGGSDPSDGDLYVPMRITPPLLTNETDLSLTVPETMKWHVDKSIHLAKGLNAGGEDISMTTREGNITLYQFVQLDSGGDVVIDAATGLSKTIEDGPTLKTTGNILMDTEAKGTVGLNAYSELEASDITLKANGQFYMVGPTPVHLTKKTQLKALGNILVDTTRLAAIPGNRDIYFENSSLILSNSLTAGRKIELKSRNAINIKGVEITGNVGANSTLNLSSKTGVKFEETNLTNIGVLMNDNAEITGGSWTLKPLTVPEGKTLKVKRGVEAVDNGPLVLGSTGIIDFDTNMGADLKNLLHLFLGNGITLNEVVISSDYGRNTAYATPSSGMALTAPGAFKDLGASRCNLEIAADKVGGTGRIGTLVYSFDNGTISISGTATAATRENVVLTVRDKLSGGQVFKTVNFTFSASGPGPAQITVTGDNVPIDYTVVFKDFDGTELKTETVLHGSSATPPAVASRYGYTFTGWSGPYVNITGDTTLTAMYAELPRYQVRFLKNDGTTTVHATLQAYENTGVGSLPANPTRTNYVFKNWSIQQASGGAVFDGNTPVPGNIDVYAQWKKRFVLINNWEHIKIGSTVLQKISTDRLLVRSAVTNYSWADALAMSTSYYTSINPGWLNGSDLLDIDTADAMPIEMARYSNAWWTSTSYSSKDAWYEGSDGYSDHRKKTNSIGFRPYVTVGNTANLVVQSGTGTLGDPYVLAVE